MSIDEAIEAYSEIFRLGDTVEPSATEKKKPVGFLRHSRLFGKSKAPEAPQVPVQPSPRKGTGTLLGSERFDERITNIVRNGPRLTSSTRSHS